MYIVIEKNRLCGDDGKVSVDENDCRRAALDMKLEMYPGTISDFPRGCYIGKSNTVFFNQHSAGSREQNSAPICVHAGKI